jgi:hypothetical protein
LAAKTVSLLTSLGLYIEPATRRQTSVCLGRGRELPSKLPVEILLAPIADDKSDSFDLHALSDQFCGVNEPNMRESLVHGHANFLAKEVTEIRRLAVEHRRKCVKRNPLGVRLFDDVQHSLDVPLNR